MARLLDRKTAIKLLESDGWTRGTGGKHVVKMERAAARPVTLPHHGGQAYGKGLTHRILREAGFVEKGGQWISPSRHMQRDVTSGHTSQSSRDASRRAGR